MTSTAQGGPKLLVTIGWSRQVPASRAMERNDETVAGWAEEGSSCVEDSRRRGGWLVREDKTGISKTPTQAKTWS
ncbi:hypothetical protein GCM10010421_28210 [Streptomyces glaucus]|uniref:Uncharacterized protein n=2 Tax=Streptomyces glaucus TaxID=284029 RepID=A0ABP5WYC7_9ACTN